MTRTSWFDEQAEHPTVHEQVSKLQSFTSAIADGVVEKGELDAQARRLAESMKRLEPELNDQLHAQVTNVLVELTAYNIMRLLHELQAEHARIAFGGSRK